MRIPLKDPGEGWYKEVLDYIYSIKGNRMIFIGASNECQDFYYALTNSADKLNKTYNNQLELYKSKYSLKSLKNNRIDHNKYLLDHDMLFFQDIRDFQNVLTIDNKIKSKYIKLLKKYKEISKNSNCLSFFIFDNIREFKSKKDEELINRFRDENKDIFDIFIFITTSNRNLLDKAYHYDIDFDIYDNSSKIMSQKYLYINVFNNHYWNLLIKKDEHIMNKIKNASALNLDAEDIIELCNNK